MHLVIVRHGETAWTRSGQYTGASDIALTARGDAQAAALAPVLARLTGRTAPTVHVSPRARTRRTAELALAGVDAHVDDRVVEFDYGAYEGMTYDEIVATKPGWNLWRDGCPDGESLNAVTARADSFLADAAAEAMPVVVTHGHFSRLLVARAVGLAAREGERFDSAVASVAVVADHHGRPTIALWNATADLFGAVDP